MAIVEVRALSRGGAGSALFQQNCAFCHGRDAMGGETGPDLTRSKLVLSDTDGRKIAAVVREGGPATTRRCRRFSFPASKWPAWWHSSARAWLRCGTPGGRRGVDVADLQTGNADAGKAYFNGAGGCAKCHSPTGDLAGIASRYRGTATGRAHAVSQGCEEHGDGDAAFGQKMSGTLAYLDEFTVALRDSDGVYRSWPMSRRPVTRWIRRRMRTWSCSAKYTDDDIHNLMAYLQTLR